MGMSAVQKKRNHDFKSDLLEIGHVRIQKKLNRLSDLMEIGQIRICVQFPKKMKLHVGFDGNWANQDFKK